MIKFKYITPLILSVLLAPAAQAAAVTNNTNTPLQIALKNIGTGGSFGSPYLIAAGQRVDLPTVFGETLQSLTGRPGTRVIVVVYDGQNPEAGQLPIFSGVQTIQSIRQALASNREISLAKIDGKLAVK